MNTLLIKNQLKMDKNEKNCKYFSKPIPFMDELPEFMSPILPVTKICNFELEQLSPAPPEWNFYSQLSDTKMIELIDSIENNGLIHPVTIWEIEDKYIILSGHNRVKAYQMLLRKTGRLEYSKILCNVKSNITEQQAQEILIDANWIQRNLTPAERTHSICQKYVLMGRKKRNPNGTTHENNYERIAREYNLSSRQVHRYIQLGRLIPALLQLVDIGTITMQQGIQLSFLKPEEQIQLEHQLRSANQNDIKYILLNKNLSLSSANQAGNHQSALEKVTLYIPSSIKIKFLNHFACWLKENILP